MGLEAAGAVPAAWQSDRVDPMPLLFFVLIVLLIAQVGFWHTLGAILGAVLMVVVLIVLLAGLLIFGILNFLGGMGRRPPPYPR
jgi:hypothetical protein